MPRERFINPRDQSILVTLTMLREAGVTAEEADAMITAGIKRLAAKHGWRAAETAATLADWAMKYREVWK